MSLFIIALVIGLIFLTLSADKFIKGTTATASHLGIPQLVIGIVVIGFGTSAPEMLVSALASYDGLIDIGIGNAIGSNITNSTLVLGATALVAPLFVGSKLLRRELPLLFFCCGLSYYFLMDYTLTRPEGIILLLTMCAVLTYIGFQIRSPENKDDPVALEIQNETKEILPLKSGLLWLTIGLIGLLASSRAIVWGAVGVAEAFEISELIIGLTVIAIGTSLPELAASVSSALQKQHDLALGNIIGSNMFNILAVIGICGTVGPNEFDSAAVNRDFLIMIGALLLVLPMMLFKSSFREISRIEGGILLAAFILYQVWLYKTVV